MIVVENVRKYYNKGKRNEVRAIENTSMEISEKGITAILGHSGCGKTTLLNAIGGLDNIDTGRILIDGDDISGVSSSKRDEIRNNKIGYIFQNYNLIENMTVFQNVAIVLKMIGMTDSEKIRERVYDILEAVDIKRYKNRPVNTLSGGEQQRVGIARAIVKNPDIIIADEPTGNLDSRNTIEIMNLIKAISKEKTVILVTHERSLAEFYSDRIIEIRDGKLVEDRKNINRGTLDYRLDSKVYLKDMPIKKELATENVKIDFYSDSYKDINIKVVLKNNNIYIETDGTYKNGSSDVELINDNYKEISKESLKNISFDFETKDEKKVYNSIVKPTKALRSGFKRIGRMSRLKKILLIGFVIASMLITYSISSIIGINTVDDESFMVAGKNYIQVNSGKVTKEKIKKLEKIKGVDYVVPGDSIVRMLIEIDDLYQTKDAREFITGSAGNAAVLDKNDIKYGKLPKKENEIAIDERIAKRTIGETLVKNAGLYNEKDFIGKEVATGDNINMKITAVVKTESPSIYIHKDKILPIILTYPSEDSAEDEYNMPAKKLSEFKYMRVMPKPGKKEAVLESLKGKVNVKDCYKTELEEYKYMIHVRTRTTMILALIMMIISFIEMYMMQRASFLSRIKEVGVLRAVGLKKSDIYRKFSGEILAITILTSIPGVAFMSYIIFEVTKIEHIKDNFMLNPGIIIATVVFIVIFNLIAGLIPVWRVMSKTPAEILSRKDIN